MMIACKPNFVGRKKFIYFVFLDLVERHGGNNSEVFHFHGRKTALPGVEVCKTFSGRKRNNSDSAYTSLIKDRMLPLGSDSLESSRIHKVFPSTFLSCKYVMRITVN